MSAAATYVAALQVLATCMAGSLTAMTTAGVTTAGRPKAPVLASARGYCCRRAEAFQITDSLLSPRGHFVLYYTLTGPDAISPLDADGSGWPDFAETAGAAFETSYAIEVEELGYNPPPGMEAWTRPYRVYLLDLGTMRGQTVAEGRDPEAPVQHGVLTHIEVDNDFANPQEHLSAENALRATAAHEFFHAIQHGYVSRLITVDGFFAELTAMWMEEQVFPGLNDYRHYLDDFFSAPDIPLNAVSLTVPRIIKHMYGACVFAVYLEERFGRDVMRRIWEQMVHEPALEAIATVCADYGSSFEEELTRFALWNFFTGSRHLPGYGYSQADTFPEVLMRADTVAGSHAERAGQAYFLTATYLPFRLTTPGTYRITIEGQVPSHWSLGAVYSVGEVPHPIQAGPGQAIQIQLPEPQTITVIACNVDRSVTLRMLYFKEQPESYVVTVQRLPDDAQGGEAPFTVLGAHPNPASAVVTFTIERRVGLPLVLEVSDVLGRRMGTIWLSSQRSGSHQLCWPASPNTTLAPGIYFCRFSCPGHAQTVKVTFCQ
ncbi:MAG: DUF6055 domain-containing protein [candidate division KSB1 bacterium]|nr:DUF6055 domain-containing protein [candidate division KSB1 bacterium]